MARSLTHWARPGIKPASSQTLGQVLNLLGNRNASFPLLNGQWEKYWFPDPGPVCQDNSWSRSAKTVLEKPFWLNGNLFLISTFPASSLVSTFGARLFITQVTVQKWYKTHAADTCYVCVLKCEGSVHSQIRMNPKRWLFTFDLQV